MQKIILLSKLNKIKSFSQVFAQNQTTKGLFKNLQTNKIKIMLR